MLFRSPAVEYEITAGRRVALLEQQSADQAQPDPEAPVPAEDASASHAAPHPSAQDAWTAAKAAGSGLLGGLFAWAAPRKAAPETIDKEKLARLDEKLRARRYKNWDDVMHG